TLWHPEVAGWDFEKPGPGAESGDEEKGEPKSDDGKDEDHARGDHVPISRSHLAPAAASATRRGVSASVPTGGRAVSPSLPAPGDPEALARSTPGGFVVSGSSRIRSPAGYLGEAGGRGGERASRITPLALTHQDPSKTGPGDQEKGKGESEPGKGEEKGEEKGE